MSMKLKPQMAEQSRNEEKQKAQSCLMYVKYTGCRYLIPVCQLLDYWPANLYYESNFNVTVL